MWSNSERKGISAVERECLRFAKLPVAIKVDFAAAAAAAGCTERVPRQD